MKIREPVATCTFTTLMVPLAASAAPAADLPEAALAPITVQITGSVRFVSDPADAVWPGISVSL
jgi:hypothetical protein